MCDVHIFYTDNEDVANELVISIQKMYGSFTGVAKLKLPATFQIVVRDSLPDSLVFAIRSFCAGYNTCYLRKVKGYK